MIGYSGLLLNNSILSKSELLLLAADNEMGKSVTFKGMNYTSLIPLLLTAIQEQQKRIEALEAALKN